VLEQDPGERMPPTQRASGAPFTAHAATSASHDIAPNDAVPNDVPPDEVAARDATLSSVAASPIDPEWVVAQLSRLDLLLHTLVEPEALARLLLLELAPLVGATHGAAYSLVAGGTGEGPRLCLRASYAAGTGLPESVMLGEGLIGQCAVERRKLVVRDIADEHFRARSTLGASAPRELVFIPVWLNDATLSVLELGFTSALTPSREALLDRLAERRPAPGPRGEPRPERAQRGEAARLSESGIIPRQLPSHRSGFWGKLSHELRSPLNSVLVLSQLLSENEEHNLTAKQVSFAKAIHASGNDLLALINAISDLSKIETNRLVLEPTEMPFSHFKAHLDRAFEPVAKQRGLEFVVELGPGLPSTLVTDAKRLRQIMKCLLSNAFKFTESGRVAVRVSLSRSGWSPDRERLNNVREVVAFSVIDTGVGMSESEQRSILEVFPPERIESRRALGASGLGLAISRELARLLGGDLRVTSVVGSGSTFTLYLPTCGLPSVAPEERAPESEMARVSPGLAGMLQSGAPAAEGVPSPAASPEPRSPAAAASPAPITGDAGRSGRRDVEPGSRRSTGRSGKRRDGPEASSPTELAGLSIMLVDDDVRSAFALTGLLERQGAAVSHAEDVSEALQRLGEGRGPAVLLIDAELLMSGSERSVQHVLELGERLPIVALTSERQPSSEAARRVPPAVRRLAKPVDTAELLSLLRGVVARAKSLES